MAKIWNLDLYTGYVQKGLWRQLAPEEEADYFKKTALESKDELLNVDIFPDAHSVQIKDDIIIVALEYGALKEVQDLVK
ncbi:hypothetical protein FACS1894145_5310 [Bacteroidia bacterium]|nr:hypothetical protein FACS1894145_5310 [Bacteroidia bacterium]